MSSIIPYDGVASLPVVPATPLPRCRSLVAAGGALIGVFVVGFGIWASVAPLESAVVAGGTVVVESSRKTIQHLEGGIVAAILVHDGDAVTAGQTLVRLDDTKARTTLQTVTGQLRDARAAEARLFAERDVTRTIAFPADLVAQKGDPSMAQTLAGQQKIFETRRMLDDSKTAAIRERINQVREEIVGYQAETVADDRRIALIAEEIASAKDLVAKGLDRKPHLLSLQRDLAEIQGKRGETMAQIAKAKQTIAESEVNILTLQNDTQKQAADELRETQRKIHEYQQQAEAAENVLARIEIKAPEDGTITDLKLHTLGGVVTAGEPLMDIVPKSDRLVVEAQVRPVDIDRLRDGLTAQVRLLPYKSRRTPPLDAEVIYVSADNLTDKKTNQPYYSVKLKVDEAELAGMPDVKLIPGMPAEAMIKTGETTVAVYALSPILDSFHRSFHER